MAAPEAAAPGAAGDELLVTLLTESRSLLPSR
jgi:hypothetical protein